MAIYIDMAIDLFWRTNNAKNTELNFRFYGPA
jgi:hypothetical protein